MVHQALLNVFLRVQQLLHALLTKFCCSSHSACSMRLSNAMLRQFKLACKAVVIREQLLWIVMHGFQCHVAFAQTPLRSTVENVIQSLGEIIASNVKCMRVAWIAMIQLCERI